MSSEKPVLIQCPLHGEKQAVCNTCTSELLRPLLEDRDKALQDLGEARAALYDRTEERYEAQSVACQLLGLLEEAAITVELHPRRPSWLKASL
jgi:hypothetical protein